MGAAAAPRGGRLRALTSHPRGAVRNRARRLLPLAILGLFGAASMTLGMGLSPAGSTGRGGVGFAPRLTEGAPGTGRVTAQPLIQGGSLRLSSGTLAKLHPFPELPSLGSVTSASLSASGSATGSRYTALTPSRILDTRSGSGPLGPGQTLNLTVVSGSVPSTAVAVAVNVTVTATTAASFLSLYPAQGTRPVVSNLNWTAGQTVANLAIVPIGQGGQIAIYNHTGSTEVLVDLEGYFSPEPSGAVAGSYVPLPPERIVDTRPGSGEPYSGDTLLPGTTLNVDVAGAGDVPAAGVAAALLNVTVTGTTAAGYLSVYPQGSSLPTSSNLNWTKGETVANRVLVPVGQTGEVTLYNHTGSTQVAVDVSGYFTQGTAAPDNASLYTALAPVRLLDTRLSGSPLGPGQTLTQPVAGEGGIPAVATAVVSNVTATDTTAASYFTVYPGGARPLASDVNWTAGQTVPNLTIATLGSTGATTIYNYAGQADAIMDAFGYFSPGSTTSAPLAVTTTSLPEGAAGTTISDGLEATGGRAPYSWRLVSGSLPSGLTLTSDGLISGITEQAGTVSFEVGVEDSSSPTPQSATAQLTLTISGPTTSTIQSPNWSGYYFGSGPYTAVTGTFTVPSLYQGQSNTYMAEWVGIDGAANSDLIQAGIVETEDPSNPSDFYIIPWWEILPSPETPITTLQVGPGDQLQVTITQQTAGEWAITLRDLSSGGSFTTDQSYTGPLSSAEWIVEAPEVNGSLSTLADYTTTTFTHLGLTGPYASEVESLMVQGGQQVSTPSALSTAGFEVAYGATAPPSP